MVDASALSTNYLLLFSILWPYVLLQESEVGITVFVHPAIHRWVNVHTHTQHPKLHAHTHTNSNTQHKHNTHTQTPKITCTNHAQAHIFCTYTLHTDTTTTTPSYHLYNQTDPETDIPTQSDRHRHTDKSYYHHLYHPVFHTYKLTDNRHLIHLSSFFVFNNTKKKM